MARIKVEKSEGKPESKAERERMVETLEKAVRPEGPSDAPRSLDVKVRDALEAGLHEVLSQLRQEIANLRASLKMDFLDREISAGADRDVREAFPHGVPGGATILQPGEVLYGPKVDVGPSPDAWAHRSAKMKCATCMWFVEKWSPDRSGEQSSTLKPEGRQMIRELPVVGRCRRHSPSMNGYPVVYADDWCGDHKLDEAKA